MFNTRTMIIGTIAIVVAGVGAYVVKTTALDREQELRALNRQIAEEQDRITVLEADWSYLTRPSRIQHLSQEMLAFKPVKPERILTLDTLDGDAASSQDEGLFQVNNIKGIE